MTAHDSTEETSKHQSLAAVAILIAAVTYSSGPLLIHWTSKDIDPFYFNFFVLAPAILLRILFLVATKKQYVDRFFQRRTDEQGRRASESPSVRLRGIAPHLAYLERTRSTDTDKQLETTIISAEVTRPSKWIKIPLLWVIVSSFQFGFLAWSAQLVETAITTTVYELWPAFVVYGLARHEITNAQYLEHSQKPTPVTFTVPREHLVLTLLAVVGLVFMLGSQAGDQISSLRDILTYDSLIGIFLALIAAGLGSMTVLGTIAYGRVMYYQLVDEAESVEVRDARPIENRGSQDRKLLLWLTLLGFSIAECVSLPGVLVAVFATSAGETGISAIGLLGGALLGSLYSIAAVLVRVGNIRAPGPGVNALFFLSPLLALAWLMAAGVSLPRFDLFIVGAALIIAINILIQLKPDQGRDFSRFGKDALPGARLGFTAFILSIWIFGTVVYVRDEVLPSTWLQWPGGEYWSLIALSATIFALILGFRVARLAARISHEDEMMLGLFRECENLAGREVLRNITLDKLGSLDTVQPNELLKTYNDARQEIRSAMKTVKDREDAQALVSVAVQLDRLAHSKQQGRDIVELLSLTAFAIVTIGLGILSRPSELAATDASWSGFLSEVFIFLFVSTVSFLCVNLFDIRRERETPLLVRVKQFDDDYSLFFRYKRDLSIQHITAVLISVAMSVTFCVLLYGKWL